MQQKSRSTSMTAWLKPIVLRWLSDCNENCRAFSRAILVAEVNSSSLSLRPFSQNSVTLDVLTTSLAGAKTLPLEWNTNLDEIYITVHELPPSDHVTKQILFSVIAKTYDVFGWFFPTIIKMKILLQRLRWTGMNSSLIPSKMLGFDGEFSIKIICS